MHRPDYCDALVAGMSANGSLHPMFHQPTGLPPRTPPSGGRSTANNLPLNPLKGTSPLPSPQGSGGTVVQSPQLTKNQPPEYEYLK